MISIDQVANPKYGSLYIPSVSLLYLWTLPLPEVFHLWGITVPNPGYFPHLAIVTFLGATLTHNLFSAIFGPGGPGMNPKKEHIVKKYMWVLLLNIEEDQIAASQMQDKIDAIWEIVYNTSCRKKFRGLGLVGFLWVNRLLAFYTMLILFYYFMKVELEFLVILLFLGILAIFLDGWIPNPFPITGSPESAEHLYKPEYKRFEERRNDRKR